MPALRAANSSPMRDREIHRRQRRALRMEPAIDDAGGGPPDESRVAPTPRPPTAHHPHDLATAPSPREYRLAFGCPRDILVGIAPALGQPAGHSIATSTSALRRSRQPDRCGRASNPIACAGRLARHVLGDQRQPHEDDRPDQRGDAIMTWKANRSGGRRQTRRSKKALGPCRRETHGRCQRSRSRLQPSLVRRPYGSARWVDTARERFVQRSSDRPRMRTRIRSRKTLGM